VSSALLHIFLCEFLQWDLLYLFLTAHIITPVAHTLIIGIILVSHILILILFIIIAGVAIWGILVDKDFALGSLRFFASNELLDEGGLLKLDGTFGHLKLALEEHQLIHSRSLTLNEGLDVAERCEIFRGCHLHDQGPVQAE